MQTINRIAFRETIDSQLEKIKTFSLTVLFISLAIALVDYAVNRHIKELYQAELSKRFNAPAELWFEVKEIIVHDTPIGFEPFIKGVQREFKFNGKLPMKWEATISHERDGYTSILCSGSGSSNNYSKRSILNVPVPMVTFWLGKRELKQCEVWPFPKGKTCLNTVRTFYPRRWPNDPLDVSLDGFGSKVLESPEVCWTTTDGPLQNF